MHKPTYFLVCEVPVPGGAWHARVELTPEDLKLPPPELGEIVKCSAQALDRQIELQQAAFSPHG